MIKNTTSEAAVATRHGFHLVFKNGWTVSVQWGRSMYCDTRDSGAPDSPTAEIACWPPNGGMVQFTDGDEVSGWASADVVAKFCAYVAAIDPKNPPDVIDLSKIEAPIKT